MTWTITGRVRGVITFPERPDYEGQWGLQGGEDATAERDSFRSPTEAARWCQMVLDGQISPRWTAAGPLLEPWVGPTWSTAEVVASSDQYADDDRVITHDGTGWTEACR